MKAIIPLFVFFVYLMVSVVLADKFYFDYDLSSQITNYDGSIEIQIKSLAKLSGYHARGFSENCNVWIYDKANQRWIYSKSSWNLLPSADSINKIKIKSIDTSNICEISFELKDTYGNVYTTPKKKVWLYTSYGDYIQKYNEGLISINNYINEDAPTNVFESTSEMSTEVNPKYYLLLSLVSLFTAFYIGFT